MDPANISWLESDATDSYWETYHRRGNTQRYWDRSSDSIPPDFDDNEDAWNDIRRRERLAEAMYEC
jgi:hypothetical protein